MPYNVQLPNGVTIEGIPDDVSQEEARKQILKQFPDLQEKPKFKDYLKDIPKAVGRGGVGLLETSAIGASALLPEEYEKSARRGIESLAAPARQYLAPSSQEVGESVSSQLAAGVGSTLPFFALGPLGVAGRVGAGALGVSAGAGEARQAAEAAGATPEEISKATMLGAPTGLLDIIAPEIKPFKNLLTTAALRGGVEGLTEAAQKVSQNLIARGIYNPEQEILVGAGEEGAYGAGVGALTSLIVDLTLGRRAHVDLGKKLKELGQTPVAIQPPVETLPPAAPGGLGADEAEALRQEAAAAEQQRLADIEAARVAQQQSAQQAALGMAGFAGPAGINAQMISTAREEREAEQKRAELERKQLIKQINATKFSDDPFQDQMLRNRELQKIGAFQPVKPTQAAAALPDTPAVPPVQKPKVVEPPAPQNEVQGMPIQEVPLSDLKLSKDVPQFKIGASEKGVVEPLGGKFERTGVAPIQVWRRLDGSLEVISGRHRFDLAQRSGEKSIPAQIHDEAQGFGSVQAAILDAELNIRDGQGKVKDYVNYFKESGIDREAAESKGLLARATGKRSFTIANQGSDELITAVRGDQVGDEAAYYIALNAPNDERLQSVGIRAVMDGKSMNTAVNTMQAVKALAGENDTSIDMFGFDESAIKEAEEMAKIAAQKQREIQTRLAAITGAAKNPAVAKAEGIDIRDPAAVQRRIAELRQLKSAWDNWSTSPELVAEIREARGVPAPVLKPTEEEVLTAQTPEDLRTKAEREAAESKRLQDEERAAEEKAKADSERGEFVLTGSNRPADEEAARGQESMFQQSGGKGNSATKEGLEIQKQLKGKTFEQVVQWSIKNAPNRFQQFTAQKVKAMIDALKREGVIFNFEVQDGNSRNILLRNAEGLTTFLWGKEGTAITVRLNGEPVFDNQAGYPSGMSYGTVQHELLHVATRSATRFLPPNHPAIVELNKLYNTVVTQFNKDAKAGKLPEVLNNYFKRMNNVLASPDELITWGLTDREFQNYLANINVGPKQTAFSKFVELIREMLGIGKPFQTAMEKLVQTTEAILDVDTQEVKAGMMRQNVTFGKAVPTTKMKQETLFAKKAETGVNSPAFKRWFGDSKVVDQSGGPLVVYHGSNKDFTVFSPDAYRNQSFFTNDADVAATYAKSEGGNIYPVYLSIKKPFEFDANGESWDKIAKKSMPKDIASKLIDANAQQGIGDNALFSLSAIAGAAQDAGYDGLIVKNVKDSLEVSGGKNVSTVYVVNDSRQIKSAIGNRGTYDSAIADILYKAADTPRTQLGNDAMEMLSGIGRSVAEPEPGYFQRVATSWNNYRDNPQATREAAYGQFRRFADQVETWAFSSDAALNNQIRNEVMHSMEGQEQKIGMLLNTSLSQTAHSDAVANLFLMEGNIKYDTELHKWVGVKDENNIINLSKKLDEIANQHGLSKAEVELLAHTAFEARRTQSLIDFNNDVEKQADVLKAQAAADRAAGRAVAAHALSEKAQRLLQKKKVVTNMSPEELATGLKLYDLFPGLRDVTKIWNGIRQNGIDRMVETGLYTEEEAEMLMSVADYVPFYREEQIEEGKGPKEFMRSLSVQADKRLKGSAKPVNDIFDNMVRWTQYAINRGVRNRSAVALATTAEQLGLADKVNDPREGDNVVRVWENGQESFYNMHDPLFVSAFRGLESVAIPTIKVFSKFADLLRQSVVLYPLFSVAQVPQDSFAAMFTSGLKPQHALTIPLRAVKEFIQTLRGKSKAHEELKSVGAAGVRDFTSAIIRADAEIAAGLKQDKGLWNGVKRRLGNLAMAADNAVRQATYEAALAQGLSRKEAMEKAFEIFNVRRRGNSKMLALAGQVIPFFNAYLAAQHVAYRTLTGVGTSPTERKAALQTLAATTGSVMVLSMLYAMMMGDDDDYITKPTPTRDRLLIIPGTGGIGIPLRADIFALPKVLAEHTYLLMTDNGFEDGAKFRSSVASILANSIFSPTPVPQAVKPIVESIINYDFFQQKPLVGTFQQKKELSRQFEDSTSEFAKVLGSTNLISPIVADHLVRGMFGSFGGLFLYATNPVLSAMSDTPRPALTMQDALATIPNASAFVSKEYEAGLRKDFYALKEATDRVADTMSDLKNRSPQEIADYLSDETVQQRLSLSPAVNQIAQKLTAIRKAVTAVSNAPESAMDENEKQRRIKELRQAEEDFLKNVNLKKLREMANL